MCSYNDFCYKTYYSLKIIIFIFRMIEYFDEDLAKKIKEAKETNNLERENYFKGLCRFLSIVKNFYKILDYYEGKQYSEEYKEFKDLLWFFSYISQIFNNYLKKCIEGEEINLNKLRCINDFLAYEYCIYGGGNYGGNEFLTLAKSFKEYNEFIEELNIPTPILKTNEFKQIKRRLV